MINKNIVNKNPLIILFSLIITSQFFNSSFISIFKISIYNIIILLLFICFLFLTLAKVRFKKSVLIIYFLFFIFFYYAVSKGIIKYGLINSLIYSYLLTFLYCILFLKYSFSEEDADKIYLTLIVISIIGTILNIRNISVIELALITNTRMIYSANPISIAILCGIGFLSCIFIENRKTIFKFLMILLFLIMLITFSRGPLSALLLSLQIYFVFRNKKKLFILGLIFSIIIFLYLIKLRYANNQDISTGRIDIYINTLKYYFNNSFFFMGFGIGFFSKSLINIQYPHNFLLQILVEIGLLFFLIYIFISITIFILFFILRKIISKKELFFFILYIFLFLCSLLSFSSNDSFRFLFPLILINIKILSTKTNYLKWRRNIE